MAGTGRTTLVNTRASGRILGTTQVLSVPTVEERQGLDTTAFAGDTLRVPVNPQIASVLAGYPLPNDPVGAYGARTYATSAKVTTNTDQFSLRIDHRISDRAAFFGRFNFSNVSGPLTNPDQTAIDPKFRHSLSGPPAECGNDLHSHLISELQLGCFFGIHSGHAVFPLDQQYPAGPRVRRRPL